MSRYYCFFFLYTVRRNLQTGQEQGAAFAVYQGGRLVVDLWGGYADFGALRYRDADSISMAYSSTKMVTSLVLAHLVDAGRLEYEAPVGRYWPEFAVGEKKGITVQTLLSHRVSGWCHYYLIIDFI